MSDNSPTIVDGVLEFRFSGTASFRDYQAAQQQAVTELSAQEVKYPVLVVLNDFGGWATEGDWGDLALQIDLDPMVSRMALVADPKWESKLAMFTGQGLRPFPVRFFPAEQEDAAKTWLREIE